MKLNNENLNKKFLIYGFGKSGISSLKFLKKKNQCFIFDDDKKKINSLYKSFFISKSKLLNNNFDYIVISPGININKCQLSNYLKKNQKKCYYRFRHFL